MLALTDVELDALSRRSRAFFIDKLGKTDGEAVWGAGQYIHNTEQRALYYSAVVEDVASIDKGFRLEGLKRLEKYKWEPVPIREFIESPHYLNREPGEVWPVVLDELEKCNTGKYTEAVCTGGIGSGKTTFALYTQLYQLYLMSCLRDPHKVYGQDSAGELLLIFQSITATHARTVDFARFRTMVLSSPYFARRFPFDKHIESRLVFGRIQVVPVSGKDTAAIGQNVIGGLIDEINYMAVVEKSKKSVDEGTYDQAVAVYNSIARRRKTRFIKQGALPGILCLVSSRKYPGQFTDQKEAESREPNSTVFVYDKRVWDVKPDDYGPERFRFYVGDGGHKPRILGETEPDPNLGRVIEVPLEYKIDFEKDPYQALREIAGVATLARHPYLADIEAVTRCFPKRASIFDRDVTDFTEPEGARIKVIPSRIYRPEIARAIHVDLGATSDSAGLSMACVPEFVDLSKMLDTVGEKYADVENQWMPRVRFDFVLEVKPPPGGEILFYKIRNLIIKLRDVFGYNIQWVTFDTYESRDSQQLLRQKGFQTGVLSVDRVQTIKGSKSTDVYGYLKSAFYSGRIDAPEHEHVQIELAALERDQKTGKIDHPPKGSKDCADSMCGVCYTLTTRRILWLESGIEYAPAMLAGPDVHMKAPEPQKVEEDDTERQHGETLHDFRKRIRQQEQEA